MTADEAVTTLVEDGYSRAQATQGVRFYVDSSRVEVERDEDGTAVFTDADLDAIRRGLDADE